MKHSLRKYLLWAFLFSSLILLGVVSFLTLTLMNNHFNKYVDEKHEETLEQYREAVLFAYNPEKETWYMRDLKNITEKAQDNQVEITIKDSNNQDIWCFKHQNSNKMSHNSMMSSSHHKKKQRLNPESSNYIEKTEPLSFQKEKIGSITFGYYGNQTYTEHDIQFIRDMKKSLSMMFLAALPLSLFLASIVAKKISLPITEVNHLTKKVAKGDFTTQVTMTTTVIEINELLQSVNALTQRLDQQQILRKQLTTDIAHELRTPLTTLQGNIEAMMDGIWEITPERLGLCHNEILRLTRLVGNIEKIARLEQQNDTLVKEVFNLGSLANAIGMNFNNSFNEKQLDFSLKTADITIEADKDGLSQVITNLLSNALKFTDKGGKVTLTLQATSNEALLIVTDTGIGLSKEEQQAIFDRFYMADPARSRQTGGQGVGLAIVKSIIEAHRGSITVTSQEKKGTQFKITLPLK